MEPFVTMGLVLKETRYREADRILTILTPKLGVITAMAANSLRLKSKLFSACGLFCYSEFTLVPGRNMYTVREAEVQNIFHGISSSIEGVSLAMYLTELAAALSPTGEEAARELRLVLNSLYMRCLLSGRTGRASALRVLCGKGRQELQSGQGCAVCATPHLLSRGQKNICIQDLCGQSGKAFRSG